MSPFKNIRHGARFILTLTRATIVCLCILIWSQILEAQGLQFDPWQLDFGDVPAGSPSPLTKTATLRNSGNNTVNWNARLSPYVTGFPIWLSVSPTSGTLGAGQSATLTFSVKPDSMTPNSLRSQIDIVGDVSSTGMPVYIRFVRSAVLTFTPPSVNHALPTSGPSSQYLFNDTITVKNKGFGTPGGLVDVSSVITNTWGNGPGHSWSISVKSTTVVAGKIPSDKSGAYMLEVDARGITTPGTYRGSVVFYAPNATNWYDSVVVTLNPSGATLTITDITPDGVAYDPNYLDPTTGTHTFTDLMIDGKGLDQVTGVTFEPPNDIEVTRVAAKTNQVDFDIKVSQGAALGERDVLLTLSGNNKVNVSSSLGKKFIITRITMQFNQAVDQNALKDLTYRDKLVANKLGVVRIQFDDPNQHGRAFGAALTIEGISARTTSPESHTYQASYSEADIIAGRDYLTVPLPQPLEKGIRKVKTAMATADRFIYCPTITREIIESLPLRILGVSYRVHKPNAPPGTPPLEPPSDASAQNITDLLKLYYPVSGNKVTYIHIGTRDLPSSYKTKEVTWGGSKITILTDKGRTDFSSALGNALRKRNQKEGPNSRFALVVAFLPDYILTMDRNNDDKIEFPTDFAPLGLASAAEEVTLVAASAPLESIVAHEIGHCIISRTSEATLDVSILEEEDLGDEYEGGAIHCNVNPPVQGIKGWKNETTCPNSPFILGKDGDAHGIYTDRFAFNPATMIPMLTWIGQTQTMKNYNFMGSGTWVSTDVYNKLLQSLCPLSGSQQKLAARPSGVTSRSIRLSGTIFKNDNAIFDDFDIGSSPMRSPQTSGPYRLELQNATGAVLASHDFNVDFVQLSDPPVETDYDFFAITMDFPDGTKKIVLKKNGIQLASRTVSDNAPDVYIFSPQAGGNLSGNVPIRWFAGDPDGDSLRYTILYSPDGKLWLPVDANLTDTYYLWNSDAFPGGTLGKIAVIASDGVNTGEAETNVSFSVAQKRPTVTITNPATNTTFKGDHVLALTASGYDPEDGTLPDSAFVFSSNINGLLGKGSPLYVSHISNGTHTITVRATDKAGNIATDSIKLVVVTTDVEREKNTLPNSFALSQNYPNPFNPTTTIQFDVPVSSNLSIAIYNILGQQVKELVHDRFEGGRYSVVWDGRNQSGVSVSSGVYFVRMQASDGRQSSFVKVTKMVLVR